MTHIYQVAGALRKILVETWLRGVLAAWERRLSWADDRVATGHFCTAVLPERVCCTGLSPDGHL